MRSFPYCSRSLFMRCATIFIRAMDWVGGLAGAELPLQAGRRQQSADEIVLHHGRPAVLGESGRQRRLVLVQIAPADLVILPLVGVERRSGVGLHAEPGLAGRSGAVAREQNVPRG